MEEDDTWKWIDGVRYMIITNADQQKLTTIIENAPDDVCQKLQFLHWGTDIITEQYRQIERIPALFCLMILYGCVEHLQFMIDNYGEQLTEVDWKLIVKLATQLYEYHFYTKVLPSGGFAKCESYEERHPTEVFDIIYNHGKQFITDFTDFTDIVITAIDSVRGDDYSLFESILDVIELTDLNYIIKMNSFSRNISTYVEILQSRFPEYDIYQVLNDIWQQLLTDTNFYIELLDDRDGDSTIEHLCKYFNTNELPIADIDMIIYQSIDKNNTGFLFELLSRFPWSTIDLDLFRQIENTEHPVTNTLKGNILIECLDEWLQFYSDIINNTGDEWREQCCETPHPKFQKD